MKSTRTRAKNDVIGSRRRKPIILSDFLPQFYQGRVCKHAAGPVWVFLRHTSGKAFGYCVGFGLQRAPNMADLRWNRVSSLGSTGLRAETLPLG
ncbi:hypothetical protein AVEN_192620-1 [Araneus ventricosus]|uniref:Uncharacterized protein n=1 Tax=Araneus ventricosus TaxID=182803 RepID=A0A4Y2UMI4_ARAVE|nr:hypothetical protein AVEN_192620-1 [Araneus ventricosus]